MAHHNDHKDDKKKEPPMGLGQRLFTFCLLLLGATIALVLVLQLLAHIWMWILLIALVIVGIWVLLAWRRRRQDRW